MAKPSPHAGGIDESHPLASGLVVCIPLWEGSGNPEELKSAQDATSPGGLTWSQNPDYGPIVNLTDTQYLEWADAASMAVDDAVTAHVLLKRTGTANSSGGVLAKVYSASSPFHSWSILNGAAGSINKVKGELGISGSVRSTSLVPSEIFVPTDRFVHIFLTWQSGEVVTIRLYEIDGTFIGSSVTPASYTGTMNYAAQPLRMGASNTVSNNYHADFVVAHAWDRKLSDAEIETLISEPFGLLTPAQSIWTPPEPPSGAHEALWDFPRDIHFRYERLVLEEQTLTYPEVIVDTLGYWRLGESAGTTADDSSGNNRDGTYLNSPTLGAEGLLTGDADTSVQLNGTDESVEIAHNAIWNLTGDLTIVALVHFTSAGGTKEIVSKDDTTSGSTTFSLRVENGDKLRFVQEIDVPQYEIIDSTTTLLPNTTYHVAVTKQGTEITLYIDGKPDATGQIEGPITTNTDPVRIGRRDAAGGFFVGRIDEVAIYDYALTSSRIALMYAVATQTLQGRMVSAGFLEGVLSDGSSVAYDSEAEIKGTARFSVQDEVDTFDWLSDRIKPWMVTTAQDGTEYEYPLGVFLPTSPTRVVNASGVVARQVEAYDQLVVLRDDKIETRLVIASGSDVIEEVTVMLQAAGVADINIEPSSATLAVAMEWEPNTSRLKVVNDLLTAINYRTLHFDQDGVARSEMYQLPSTRPITHTYETDEDSVVTADASDTLDLFGVPNRWVGYVSNPDSSPLRSAYTNESESSPTSTVNRGRTIPDIRQLEAVDQATLDALVQKAAFEGSQVYEEVEILTAGMPTHGDSDVVRLTHSGLGLSDIFAEIAWELPMQAGALMRHRLRKVISV